MGGTFVTSSVAEHRPRTRTRRNRWDDLVAVEMFSGFGGFTQGIDAAGFTTILAANHNAYKVEIHEANHPTAEHWIADLVDPSAGNYQSAKDLPKGDLLVAAWSCTNHSIANSQRAYAKPASLFDVHDEEYESRVTRSERDRATANCVLEYAAHHRPLMIVGECTTEFVCWGKALPNKPKIGDGSTYRWWLSMFEKLGYKHKVLYLNSMFFGVGQSRDRAYWVFWDKRLPTPDLEHRPESWCAKCDEIVEAEWSWRTRVPPSGSVRYGKQYDYRCPWCRSEVKPPFTPSLDALDLSDLGTRIGDRPIKEFVNKKTGEVFRGPLAQSTMQRAERCRQRFAEFPAVLMPAKALYGAERSPYEPMGTQTSQQEVALLSTGMATYAHEGRGDGHGPDDPLGAVTSVDERAVISTSAIMKAAGNQFEWPGSSCRSRPVDDPMWTQSASLETGLISAAGTVDFRRGANPRGVDNTLPTQTGSETMGVLSAGIVLYRQNTIPQSHAEPMGTQTSECIPGVLSAAGRVQCNGDPAEAREYPLDRPLGTVVGSAITQGLLFGGWYKQNGSSGAETAPHPMSDPYGTITGRDTTAMLMAQWSEQLADLKLEDCHFRMMMSHEIGRACGFDVDFPGYGYQGSYLVWGSARDQTDGYGNAVSKQVGTWIGERLYKVLHEDLAS